MFIGGTCNSSFLSSLLIPDYLFIIFRFNTAMCLLVISIHRGDQECFLSSGSDPVLFSSFIKAFYYIREFTFFFVIFQTYTMLIYGLCGAWYPVGLLFTVFPPLFLWFNTNMCSSAVIIHRGDQKGALPTGTWRQAVTIFGPCVWGKTWVQ